MAVVTLLKAKWVIRSLRVETELGAWLVEYRGYYPGSEAVFVDGLLAQRRSSGFAMVRLFEFAIGPHRATLRLDFDRLWSVIFPRITSFVIELDGNEVYREGHELPRARARFT